MSQSNIASDPVIVHINGGTAKPGCSSMLTYVLGTGPYTFIDQQMNLSANAYSLNLNASVFYIDSINTGYSKQNNDTLNDMTDAFNNFQALKDIKEKFSALENNSFWLMGEGYGGVQVPYLVNQITDNFLIDGVILGNPVTNYKFDGLPAQVDFALARGQIDDELYELIVTNCNLAYFNIFGDVSGQCQKLLDKFFFYTNLTNQFDMYARCYPNQTLRCLWSNDATEYFNSPLVKQQLHIDESVSWSPCNEGISYERSVFGSQWIYEDMLARGSRVLVYSGNSDSIVPSVGTERWIRSLNFTITKEWAPYFLQTSLATKQVAGYFENYGNLTFATVHGGGHIPGRGKPAQFLDLIYNFINNSLK